MGTAGKVTGRAWSIPKSLAAGAGCSMLITILVSAISAHLISEEIIAQEKIGYCVMTILITASCMGSWFASRKAKSKFMQTAALNGIVYFALLLSVTALFFGGQYRGMGVTFAVVALGSIAGGMLAAKGAKSGFRKRRKKVYR